MSDETPARIDVGPVLGQAFRAAKAIWPAALPLTLGLSAPFVFLTQLNAMPEFAAGDGVALWSRMVALILLSAIASGPVAVAVTGLVQAHRHGEPASLRFALGQVARLGLPAALLSVTISVAVILGAVALLVPAILISLAWSVALPALAVEQVGIRSAISRSADLTRNTRARIFGLVLVWALIAWAPSAVFRFVLEPVLPTDLSWRIGMALARAMITGALQVMGFALYSVLYFELRRLKGEVEESELAKVFA